MLQQEQEQAQAELVKSLGRESQGDMASLMARYGSQLAVASAAPTSAAAAPFGAGKG
jgi:hypothetical protein